MSARTKPDFIQNADGSFAGSRPGAQPAHVGAARSAILDADKGPKPLNGAAARSLDSIVQVLNGAEWNSDTRDAVARILEAAGVTVGNEITCAGCGEENAYISNGWCSDCGHPVYWREPDPLPDKDSDPDAFAAEVLNRLGSVLADTEWSADTNQELADVLIWTKVVDNFDDPDDAEKVYRCPICEETFTDSDVEWDGGDGEPVCPHCDEDDDGDGPTLTPAGVICKRCDAPNFIGRQFCQQCHDPLI